MIIGIDIDDTIAKTNEGIRKEALVYDQEYLKGKGFKKRDAYSFMEMFYWNVLDVDNFMKYIRNSKFFLGIEPIEDAAKYISKLYDEGNKIIFITKRQNNFRTKSMTKKWLKNNGFKYNKLILGANKKGEICDSEGISLFIDNDIKNVLAVKDYGIEALLMGDEYNQDEDEAIRVNSWEEVYAYVKEMK